MKKVQVRTRWVFPNNERFEASAGGNKPLVHELVMIAGTPGGDLQLAEPSGRRDPIEAYLPGGHQREIEGAGTFEEWDTGRHRRGVGVVTDAETEEAQIAEAGKAGEE